MQILYCYIFEFFQYPESIQTINVDIYCVGGFRILEEVRYLTKYIKFVYQYVYMLHQALKNSRIFILFINSLLFRCGGTCNREVAKSLIRENPSLIFNIFHD